MKLSYKLTLAYAITAIMTGGTFISCKKGDHTAIQQSPVVDESKIESLIEKMYAASDASGDKEITAAYESLSEAELETFENLRLKKDSLSLIAKAANGERISQAQQATITTDLARTRELRKTIDKLAGTKFHKASNRLSITELASVVEAVAPESKKTSGQVGIAGCPVASYPLLATTNSVAGRWYYGVWTMMSDCDYEYRFDGYYVHMRGVNWITRRLLDSYGNTVSRRLINYSDGTDTGLLLGALRVRAIVGTDPHMTQMDANY